MEGKPAVERVHPPDWLMRVVNPVMRRVVAKRSHTKLGEQLLILEFAGRRSGRQFRIPVGYHLRDGQPILLTNSGWRHNFRGGRDVRLVYRGQRRRARATLVSSPRTVAAYYDQRIRALGVRGAQRRLGIRVHVDRAPTVAELEDLVRRSGLSIVELELWRLESSATSTATLTD